MKTVNLSRQVQGSRHWHCIEGHLQWHRILLLIRNRFQSLRAKAKPRSRAIVKHQMGWQRVDTSWRTSSSWIRIWVRRRQKNKNFRMGRVSQSLDKIEVHLVDWGLRTIGVGQVLLTLVRAHPQSTMSKQPLSMSIKQTIKWMALMSTLVWSKRNLSQ